MHPPKTLWVLTALIVTLLLAGCDRAQDTTSAPSPSLDDPAPAQDPAPALADETRPAAPCPSAFPEHLVAGDHQGFLVDGEPRSFHLLLPAEPPPAAGYPLLFAFHGTTETGRSFANRANLSDFRDRGFVVVAPDAVGHGTLWPVWDALRLPGDSSPNPDLLLFDGLTACLADRLELDAERTFVAGHSAGGIMTHRVLRERSHVVAGGVAGSGIFELTGTAPGQAPESPLTVIITWGGDNDVYSGATSDGTRIARFHFAEQAALASRFYADLAGVRHVQCRGHDRGHAWLTALNPWLIDTLLSDPGDAPSPPTIPRVATCSSATAALPAPPLQAPSCTSGDSPLCAQTCARFADCLLANGTLGPALAGLVSHLGVTEASCEPCLQGCSQLAADPAEQALLRCLTQDDDLTCGPGIKGALPFIGRLETCCSNHRSSSLCRQLCDGLFAGDAAAHLLPTCLAAP